MVFFSNQAFAWKSNSVGEYDGGLSSENIVEGKIVIEGNRIHRRRVKSTFPGGKGYITRGFLLNRYGYDVLLRSLSLCITIYLTIDYQVLSYDDFVKWS